MAHMDRISMGDMYGVHEIRLQARARALQTSFYLLAGDNPRRSMRQWLKKRLSELLYARVRLKCLCLSTPKYT